MKLMHWIKILLMSSCVLALAACSTQHRRDLNSASNKGSNAYGNRTHVAGLGDNDSRFGGEGRALASKDVYYFDFDSNVVHDTDKPAIAERGARLASNPKHKIMLEGHTDPRGSREYNIGLGERRAKAVANLMRDKGVDSSQIRVVSYGAQKLASAEHTENAYQRDRRAVIVSEQR